MEKPPGFEEVPCRGLAYDPATDHFYTADWDSDIVEFDRNGDIKHSYSNELSIYGLAWDAVTDGGPWLWAYSQDVTSGNDLVLISQIDPTTGIPTGIQYEGWEDPSYDDAAGGACFTEGSRNESIFVGLTQSSADTVFGMNILGEPPDPPAISGPTSGTVRKPYDYHFTAEDPDGDDIAEYIIEWGDTTSDTVVGPFASGETVTATHTWITAGVYTITARAKDVNGLVGLEGSLEITMPKAKSMQFSLFYRFFQRYPNAFPILRQLLGL